MAATATSSAAVLDDGVQLAFIDSGAVEGGAYRTLVCVHGHTYHSGVFLRLFPLAASHRLRIIALNRRDYVGSTPFSAQELDDIRRDDTARHTSFLCARGLEIAKFLVWVIQELKIPENDAHGNPSLSLLGWSLGNVTTLAFLRHLSSYPASIIHTLKPYLSEFYIYDYAYNGMGYDVPANAYHPLMDTKSLTVAERTTVFNTFLWSYFDHPHYTTGCERSLSAMRMRALTNPTRPPTHFSAEELASCTDHAPADRSEIWFYPSHPSIQPSMRDQFLGSILLDHIDVESDVLPHITVHLLYCTSSMWNIIWGAWEAERDINAWKAAKRPLHPLKVEAIDGANHFFHYDDPNAFLQNFP